MSTDARAQQMQIDDNVTSMNDCIFFQLFVAMLTILTKTRPVDCRVLSVPILSKIF